MADPEFGLRLLYADFRDVIARYISSRLWGIPAAMRAKDLKDAGRRTQRILDRRRSLHCRVRCVDYHRRAGTALASVNHLSALVGTLSKTVRLRIPSIDA